MAQIIFYEKPGCINNTKQKQILLAAGHTLVVRNLLTEAWTTARLRCFFRDRALVECVNPTAPAIKSGQIQPEQLDWETALALMCADPLLIRRPLMQVADQYLVGFDPDVLAQWLGCHGHYPAHHDVTPLWSSPALQTCPNLAHPCTQPTLD